MRYPDGSVNLKFTKKKINVVNYYKSHQVGGKKHLWPPVLILLVPLTVRQRIFSKAAKFQMVHSLLMIPDKKKKNNKMKIGSHCQLVS